MAYMQTLCALKVYCGEKSLSACLHGAEIFVHMSPNVVHYNIVPTALSQAL